MPFYENDQSPERALLLGVDTGEYDCEISLAELEELSRTAGAEVVGTVSQNCRIRIQPPTSAVGGWKRFARSAGRMRLI